MSVSNDGTCLVWNYRTGSILRTYLLQPDPCCIVLDPADRGLYVGYADGSAHLVDFYKEVKLTSPFFDGSHMASAVEVPATDLWSPPEGCKESAILCLDLSFDATTLITGHENGKICTWDVATGSSKQLTDLHNAVTNLVMLQPTGFPFEKKPLVKLQNVVKPLYESFNNNGNRNGQGRVPLDYTFTAQFPSEITLDSDFSTVDFRNLLESPLFAQSMIDEALLELEDGDDEFADSSAVTKLRDEKAAMSSRLDAALREIKQRDREALGRKQEEDIKASRKRKRRLRRLEADERMRKREMGEVVHEEGVDQDMDDDEGSLSSSTDELADPD